MFTLTSKGDWKKTYKFLQILQSKKYFQVLDKYGRMGVQALSNATPIDSGKTASSWGYEIKNGKDSTTIYFTNDNVNKNVNIAIILQYGHGTGTGGYVQGRDYINPAIQPVFDKMANDVWREVTTS